MFQGPVWRALERVDTMVDTAVHPLTRLWAKVTGRSNFVLARGLLFLGVVLIVAGSIALFVFEPGGLNALNVVISPIWMWFGRRRMQFYRDVEREVDKANGALNLNMLELNSFVVDRLVYCIWGFALIPGVILLRPLSVGFMLYIWSHYVVMHFDCKGGKSLVKRAVELAKKVGSTVAEKTRDLVPQPQPIPVPIGV